MIKRLTQMSDEEREKYIRVIGTMVMMMEEKRNIYEIATATGLQPYQVAWNIDELLYHIRDYKGTKHCIKEILFTK